MKLFCAAVVVGGLLLGASDVRADASCTIVFRMTTETPVGNILWTVDYGAASGDFVGVGSAVECASLRPEAILGKSDEEGVERLSLALLSLTGISGTLDVAECAFLAVEAPAESDFVVTVQEAGDVETNDIEPLPIVVIQSIACEDTCGDGKKTEDEQCDDGDANSDTEPDACRTDCTTARCGDEVVDSGEECDDGNTDQEDGCSPACKRRQLCGDADDDGTVLATDALIILKSAVLLPVECPTGVCDVNDSGSITSTDALLVLRTAVGEVSLLECGPGAALD